jgi:hypothetical protein
MDNNKSIVSTQFSNDQGGISIWWRM